ncbi:MAG: hypothetical protein KDK48_03225, partial [Chlamydiia bacterium]|nr:hypothetical protein [Chlamydiia bacterium]
TILITIMSFLKFFFLSSAISTTLLGFTSPIPGPLDIRIGPESYHLTRIRAGGTEQRGLLGGVSGTVERRKRNGIYAAADGYYASGILRGHTRVNKDLDSRYHEAAIEGRAGFTIHSCYARRFDATPYLGYGYFTAKNALRPPSPIAVVFHDDYEYLAAGCLTRIVLNEHFSLGVNFTSQFSFGGKSRVTDDPILPDQELKMGEVMQFEGELPVRYVGCCMGWPITSTLGFFYRYRWYQGRENFPYDFFETRFHIYGVKWVFGTYF